MTDSPNILEQFWQKLKRRKVVRLIALYGVVAFTILEIGTKISEPFGQPEWTIKLVFAKLCIGLLFSIILYWIHDITPVGKEKIKSIDEIEEKMMGQKPISCELFVIYNNYELNKKEETKCKILIFTTLLISFLEKTD